jgi:hypothetical protein
MDSGIFWLILGVVVFSFYIGRWALRRARLKKARSWPVVDGRVDSTEIRLEKRGGNQSVFVAEIRYSFETKGSAHYGSWKRQFLLHGSAEKWTGEFAAGHPVTVHYNPAKPDDCALASEV